MIAVCPMYDGKANKIRPGMNIRTLNDVNALYQMFGVPKSALLKMAYDND